MKNELQYPPPSTWLDLRVIANDAFMNGAQILGITAYWRGEYYMFLYDLGQKKYLPKLAKLTYKPEWVNHAMHGLLQQVAT